MNAGKQWLTTLALAILLAGLWPVHLNMRPALAAASCSGIVMKADRVEGVLSLPGLETVSTPCKKQQLALNLRFSKVAIYGLTIKKQLQTPNGTFTITITSKDPNRPVELRNMAVAVTQIKFGKVFIPKLGELGMGDVELMAHKQLADTANIPNLKVTVTKGGINPVDDASPADIKDKEKLLRKLIDDAKDHKLDQSYDQGESSHAATKEQATTEQSDRTNRKEETTINKENTGANKDNPAITIPVRDQGDPPKNKTGDGDSDQSNEKRDEMIQSRIRIDQQIDQKAQQLESMINDFQSEMKEKRKKLEEANRPLNKIFAPWKAKKVVTDIKTYLDNTERSMDPYKAFLQKARKTLDQIQTMAEQAHASDQIRALDQTEAKLQALDKKASQFTGLMEDMKKATQNQPDSLLDDLDDFLAHRLKDIL